MHLSFIWIISLHSWVNIVIAPAFLLSQWSYLLDWSYYFACLHPAHCLGVCQILMFKCRNPWRCVVVFVTRPWQFRLLLNVEVGFVSVIFIIIRALNYLLFEAWNWQVDIEYSVIVSDSHRPWWKSLWDSSTLVMHWLLLPVDVIFLVWVLDLKLALCNVLRRCIEVSLWNVQMWLICSGQILLVNKSCGLNWSAIIDCGLLD